MPEERDYLRIDATVEYQQGLDNSLRASYPLVSSQQDLEAYKGNQTTYTSFKLRENPLLPKIVLIALARAADPTDKAFCLHASRHGNFGEVVADLTDALRSRRLAPRVNSHLVSIKTSTGDIQTTVHRLILEADKRRRTTYRPAPLQLYLEIENKTRALWIPEEKYALFAKTIRRAAGRYGVPFAILTCIYAGLTAKPIVELFNNQDIKRNILVEREQAGVRKAKIPSVNAKDHTNLHHMIQNIRDLLVIEEEGKTRPRYPADDYFEALGKLDHQYQKDRSQELTEFVPSHDMVLPRTVFAGMDELAQIASPREFTDPYRERYINTGYGDRFATQMITAYFDSQIDPHDLHFKELFSQ